MKLELGDELLSSLVSRQKQSAPNRKGGYMSGGDISFVFGKSTIDAEIPDYR